MAQIEITVRRDNGTAITANGTVDDAYVADIAMTLTALLFDSASVEPAPPTPAEPQPTPQPTQAEMRPFPSAPGQPRV